MEPVFRVEGVDFSYRDLAVFRDLSLAIAPGESVSVIGPSAGGKSTLLRLLAGLVAPSRGTVRYRGRSVGDLDRAARREMCRRLGMSFQNSGLFDSITAAENVSFPLEEHTRLKPGERRERVRKALAAVGLEEAADRMVHELSGGMQKRLGLARASILNPEILLLDDPTAGLDPITSRAIVELIDRMRSRHEMTLVFVTSDIPRAFEIGRRIIVIGEGRALADGTPDAIRSISSGPVYRFLRGIPEGGA